MRSFAVAPTGSLQYRIDAGKLPEHKWKVDIHTTEAYTSLTRNLLFRKGVLSLQAGFAYKTGKGDAFEDGTLAQPSDKQNGFPTMDVLMYREYKYLTAPQYSLQCGLKYGLPS